ncbi:MAG TPA: 2-dehydropantoate 2-reductase [Syntrophales bacterium]|nr:2-dehydropantoate 2-reductase [Syntrophales bacterium]HQM30147.1 2-dehydropantoate 2-reductase [Syntrophales bacterium]
MRIGIVGIGGVGGYFGGKLALKYGPSREHEIIFIARGDHLKAIREKGLKLITVDGEYLAKPTLATDNPAEIGKLDLVFFCVKSYGLENAAKTLSGNIHGKTVVIPLLNGVNITERLKAALRHGTVIRGTIYIGSSIIAPGEVRQAGGSCQLIFGPDDNAEVEKYRPIEDLLKKAGIKAELTTDIAVPIWTKYIFVSPLAGLTSMLGKTFGEILEDPESLKMLEGLLRETEAVARARGVNLPPDIVKGSIGKVSSFPFATKTSMQRDYEKGNPLELDIFMEYITRSGKELGIPTPLHDRVLSALMKKKG